MRYFPTQILALLVLLCGVLSTLLAHGALENGEFCGEEVVMTLPWKICVIEPSMSADDLKAAITSGMEEVHRVDEWMSEWKPKSLISQINDNAGLHPVKVSDEAIEAIDLSLQHSVLTHGAFDITFNAFFGLYNWKKGHERFPTDAEIKTLLPLVNYRNVIVDHKNKTVFLKEKGMKIGLGGMGEGWAVDKVVALLKAKKIRAGFVDASGAVEVWGKKPSGKLWSISIGDPRPLRPDLSRKQSIYKLYATDVAVTTAGDMEKYFIRDGKRFHHIIDPKTGHSAEQSMQVTAICKSATLCDLVDDGVFILGKDKGLAYAEEQGVAAMQIDPDKKVHFSKGIREFESPWGPAIELR